MMITGTCGFCSWIIFSVDNPSIPPILMSMMIRSGNEWCRISSASSPDWACWMVQFRGAKNLRNE